jgi:hypothetical protein
MAIAFRIAVAVPAFELGVALIAQPDVEVNPLMTALCTQASGTTAMPDASCLLL